MKYDVDLSRHESRTVQVEAANRDEAYSLAKQQAPEFRVEGAAEVTGDDDQPGAEHVVNTQCSACGRVIWEGDDYVPGEEDDLCVVCGDDTGPTP